jgi:carbamoylphosphate synthase large subunit
MSGVGAPFPVLIAAASDMMGLARLPRLLHKAGCHVTLISPEDMLVARSRFVDKKISAPPGPDGVAGVLKDHLEAHVDGYVWTIIGDEPLLREISRRRNEEWVKGIFPVDPSGEGADIITSKTAFSVAASRVGLPVPPFHVSATLEEVEEAVEDLGLPVAMKESYGSGGIEVRIVSDRQGLAGAFDNLKIGVPLLVQAFVPGLVGSTEVLYDHGRPLCWNSTYTVETYPRGTGASCIREVTVPPAIERIVGDVGSLLGFHGLGGIDWIHDTKNGVLKVIEFNPRPTPGYHFGYVGGVDFSLAVRSMLEGKEMVQKPCLVDDGRGARVSMFP